MTLWDRDQAEPAAVAASRWFEAAAAAEDAGEAIAAALWICDHVDDLPDTDRLLWAERAVERAERSDESALLQRSLLRLAEARLESGDVGSAAGAIERADGFAPESEGEVSLEQADIRLLRDYCGAAMALARTDIPDEHVPELRLPAPDARALVHSLVSRVVWGVTHSMMPVARYVAMAMRKTADFANDPPAIALAAKPAATSSSSTGSTPRHCRTSSSRCAPGTVSPPRSRPSGSPRPRSSGPP
jgi:hypothetical protein